MPKKEESISLTSTENFMTDVLQNHLASRTHIDNKINWLLGISGLIMSISMQFVFKHETTAIYVGAYIIMITSFFSFTLCLLGLDLPKFKRKEEAREFNVMYYKSYEGKSNDEIVQGFKTLKTKEDILRQYAIEISYLVNESIPFKIKYFKMSRNVMLLGLVVGMLIILVPV
jgi:hypothetical protein